MENQEETPIITQDDVNTLQTNENDSSSSPLNSPEVRQLLMLFPLYNDLYILCIYVYPLLFSLRSIETSLPSNEEYLTILPFVHFILLPLPPLLKIPMNIKALLRLPNEMEDGLNP